MKQIPEKNNVQRPVANRPRQINGKTVAAIILVTFLLFMWVRFFINKGKAGQEAQAAEIEFATLQQDPQENKDMGFVPVDLPFVEGRHDVLKHDMFVPNNYYPEEQGISIAARDGKRTMNEAQISSILNSMNVDAIIRSEESSKYKAFINGSLLKDGDTLKVETNGKTFKLSVLEIFNDKIVFNCNDTTISFKMSQLEKTN